MKITDLLRATVTVEAVDICATCACGAPLVGQYLPASQILDFDVASASAFFTDEFNAHVRISRPGGEHALMVGFGEVHVSAVTATA